MSGAGLSEDEEASSTGINQVLFVLLPVLRAIVLGGCRDLTVEASFIAFGILMIGDLYARFPAAFGLKAA
jgi:hypothetical protein